MLGDMLEAKMEVEDKKGGGAPELLEQEHKKLAAGMEMILNSLRKKARERSEDDDNPALIKKCHTMADIWMETIRMAITEMEPVRFVLERRKMGPEEGNGEADRMKRVKQRNDCAAELASYGE